MLLGKKLCSFRIVLLLTIESIETIFDGTISQARNEVCFFGWYKMGYLYMSLPLSSKYVLVDFSQTWFTILNKILITILFLIK